MPNNAIQTNAAAADRQGRSAYTASTMKVLLGNNTISNCEAALVVNGTEVFRLRSRGNDGQLVVDFDMRGPDGDRLAKVAKNNVVHAADGYDVVHAARESSVTHSESGTTIARVEEIDHETVRITGEFWVDGHHVSITEEALTSGTITMSENVIDGFSKAIALNPDSFSIGCA